MLLHTRPLTLLSGIHVPPLALVLMQLLSAKPVMKSLWAYDRRMPSLLSLVRAVTIVFVMLWLAAAPCRTPWRRD
jgi:hypothetical protein